MCNTNKKIKLKTKTNNNNKMSNEKLSSEKKSPKNLLFENLTKLSTDVKQPLLNHIINKIFTNAFDVKFYNLDMEKEENFRLASLFKESIDKIDLYLFDMGNRFNFDDMFKILMTRSSIEFIIINLCDDDYYNFRSVLRESLESIDEGLRRWKDNGSPRLSEESAYIPYDPTRPP